MSWVCEGNAKLAEKSDSSTHQSLPDCSPRFQITPITVQMLPALKDRAVNPFLPLELTDPKRSWFARTTVMLSPRDNVKARRPRFAPVEKYDVVNGTLRKAVTISRHRRSSYFDRHLSHEVRGAIRLVPSSGKSLMADSQSTSDVGYQLPFARRFRTILRSCHQTQMSNPLRRRHKQSETYRSAHSRKKHPCPSTQRRPHGWT